MMSDDDSEVQSPPKQTGGETGGGGGQTSPSEIMEATKAWSAIAKSFMYVEVSSLVLMFASIGIWGKYPDSALTSYALSVSVISLLACLGIQTAEYVRPGTLEKFEKPVSLFLFVWWAVGTGVITFKGPFTGVGNGYFSAWAGLLFTTHWALNIDTSNFTELEKGQKILVCFFAASAVEMFACIPFIKANYFLGQAAWGLTAGAVTIILCGAFLKLYEDMNIQIMKIASIFMFVMWATVAGVCTFDGPFLVAGKREKRKKHHLTPLYVLS